MSVSIKSIDPISCLSDVLLAPGNAGMFSKASVGCLTRDGRFFSGSFGIECDSHHKVFDIASITKIIVTMLYHRLAHQYPNRFHDSILVKDIIKISGDYTETLALRHLLEFRAQFKSGHPTCEYVRDKGYTFETLIESICSGGLTCAPGTVWKYSNVHTILLGYAIEVIFGISLNDLIEFELLQPLDMRRTTYGSGINNRDSINDPATRIIWEKEHRATGAAGYFSSTLDLCKLLSPLMGNGNAETLSRISFGHQTVKNQFLAVSTVESIHIGLTDQFGYGFGRWPLFREGLKPDPIEDPLGVHKLGHTGCIVAVLPSHDFVMVALTDYEQNRVHTGGSGHTRRDLYSVFGELANTFCIFSKESLGVV